MERADNTANALPPAEITHIADIEICSILDTGFSGQFKTTAELHSHSYYEMHAALQGEYSIDFPEARSIRMRPNSVCLIPGNCYHSSSAIADGTKKLAICFSYRKTKLDRNCSALYGHFENALAQIDAPTEWNSEKICGLLRLVREEMARNDLTSDIAVQGLLQQIYAELFRLLTAQAASAAERERSMDDRTERYYRIDRFFFDHYAQQISEGDLASALCLSKKQVGRILQSLFGMGFREKLTETRLQRAAKLLSETELSVEQIAYSVGYLSESGFHIAFQRRFGMTGGAYRKLVNAQHASVPSECAPQQKEECVQDG